MKLAIFIILCMIIAGGAARAQTGAEVKACWADAIHYCAHRLAIGTRSVKECLIADSRVSKACRNVLKAHGA